LAYLFSDQFIHIFKHHHLHLHRGKCCKKKWLPIGVEALRKPNSAFFALENINFSENPERATNYLEIMEKFFEIKHRSEDTLQERFDTINHIFDICGFR